jgi:hypothetical protein
MNDIDPYPIVQVQINTKITKMGYNQIVKWVVHSHTIVQVQINTQIAIMGYNQVTKWTTHTPTQIFKFK